MILTIIDCYDFISPSFSVGLVSIEKIYQTLERAFRHSFKYLEVYIQNTRLCDVFFNSLLGV